MRVLAMSLSLCLAGCATATPPARVGPPPTAEALDARLAAVTERLAVTAVGRCARTVGRTGLAIHALDQYAPGDREGVRRRYGLGDRAGVIAVVPGSAADVAGVRPDDRLMSADGRDLPTTSTGTASYATIAATLDALEAASADGTLVLRVIRADGSATLTLRPVPGCPARAVVTGARRAEASTDGVYLKVSAGLLLEVDDNGVAAVVAHELSHIVLGHPQAIRDGRARVRATEEEADRLSVALLAEAGLDPAVAPRFWRRFGPAHDGLFGDPSHGGWRERVARLDAAIALSPAPAMPTSASKETSDGD